MEKIKIFITKGSFHNQEPLFNLATKTSWEIVTQCNEVAKRCQTRNLKYLLLPSRPFELKKELKQLKGKAFFILPRDGYHGIFYYIAKNFPCAVSFLLPYNTREYFYNISRIQHKSFSDSIYLFLFKLLNASPKFYGRHQLTYPANLRSFASLVKQKIIWGLNETSYLKGNNSKLIFYSTKEEEELFLENGLKKETFRMTGSIDADFLAEEARRALKKECPITYDLLYFSQPIYYTKENNHYLLELQQLIQHCYEHKISLKIKLHPRDKIEVIEKISYGKCEIIPHQASFGANTNLDFILGAKFVMGKGSTTLTSAMLMNKYVLFLDLYNTNTVKYKYLSRPTLLINDIKLLADTLEKLNKDTTFQNMARENQKIILNKLGNFDGNSYIRMKNEIEKYILINGTTL